MIARGTLEQRGLEIVRAGVERAADEARTMNELFAAYGERCWTSRKRWIDPTRRATIAACAAPRSTCVGTTPNRSRSNAWLACRLRTELLLQALAKRRRMGFVKFLTQLRIERAKELLIGTSLNLQRVASSPGCPLAST